MATDDYEQAINRLSEAMGWSRDDAERAVDAAAYRFEMKPSWPLADSDMEQVIVHGD